MKKFCKILYLVLGLVCFGLGALGAALPVLPTTPFLLLASFLLAKGSDRFHNWFQSTRLYRRYLENFVQTKSMTARSKTVLLVSVTALLLIPFCLVDNTWARVGIASALALKYYYFLCRIGTKEKTVQLQMPGALVGERNSGLLP